jgi:hypothetical protein
MAFPSNDVAEKSTTIDALRANHYSMMCANLERHSRACANDVGEGEERSLAVYISLPNQ